MATYREQDPLAGLLIAQQTRVIECLLRFASGDGAAAISEARRILAALGDAETNVLYPAFSRVALRSETQRLLDDSRGNREEQLEALDVVAHKRAARLRKLAALELCDRIKHHGEQHISLLIPVLASQLPRAMYRAIVSAFSARYQGELELPAPPPRRQRTMMSNA
jgi:hypothetical protein